MLKITAEITGSLGSVSSNLQSEMAKVIGKTALDIEAGAKTAIMTGPATGRVYGAHQASAPGEAPANDQGNLAGSIEAKKADSSLTWNVNVYAEYAEVLELGGVHMEARPFLAPAVEAVRTGFEQAVGQAITKSIGEK